ncbi:hypothetical protein [Rhodococcus sp. RCBS9]|uniref:hypothetical protein n=1 Tax=Rhodococcus sp. RCBS9 TaxID=3031999 RepID=UPI002402C652|nr:hypothetical protein [Rhodococcus sp. RCBS9]WEX02786.1 hypothetical protein P0M12_24520 [Rhodococcus sp. RCBS9]
MESGESGSGDSAKSSEDCAVYTGQNLSLAEWQAQAAELSSRSEALANDYGIPPSYGRMVQQPPSDVSVDVMLQAMPGGGLAAFSKYSCENQDLVYEDSKDVRDEKSAQAATSRQNSPGLEGVDYIGYLAAEERLTNEYPALSAIGGVANCTALEKAGMTASQMIETQRQAAKDAGETSLSNSEFYESTIKLLCPQYS